ncbi:MAG TPA: ATP-binding protein [Actinocrinis sp.]|nr:ATP-binding protein [Actinocrinis sp.]
MLRQLDQVPFRRKINFLVLIPALAVTVALVPVVDNQVSNASQWSSAADYLSSTRPISVLIDDLANERQLSTEVIGGQMADQSQFDAAISATDNQVTTVQKAFGDTMPPDIAEALAGVDELSFSRYQAATLAQEAGASGTAASIEQIGSDQDLIMLSYGVVITGLVESMNLAGRAAAGGPVAVPEAELDLLYEDDLAENQREAALVSFAQNLAVETRNGTTAPTPPTGTSPDLSDAANTNYLAQFYDISVKEDAIALAQQQRFDLVAPAADLATMTAVSDLPQQQQIDDYQSQLVDAFQPVFDQGAPVKLAKLDQVQPTEQIVNDYETLSTKRAQAEEAITDRIIAAAQSNASSAELTAGGLVGLAILLLLVLILLSTLVRRSILRPMLRLTRAASRVAQVAQTDLERVADDDLADEETPHGLEMVDVLSRDEIGDLARAFNQLQLSAVQVLERQVAIRRNTAEMFGNMGRRIHNLTGRQLSLIDQVERSETDPVLLDRLYRIDHLAVRLQRGADSLMLLSGEQENDLGATPMRLTDVARSAIGRVEGYHRVVLSAEGDGLVEPAAIGDLTLLLSELVENAVTFSPAYSMVEVAVRRGRHLAVIEIVDHGIGLAPYRIAEENEKFIHRERLDLAPTKVLGLFVVGRLARRTGVKVALANTPDGGVTARVTVGEELLLNPGTELSPISTLPARPPAVPNSAALNGALPEPRTQSDQLHTRQPELPARRRAALPAPPPAPPSAYFTPASAAPPTPPAHPSVPPSNGRPAIPGPADGAAAHDSGTSADLAARNGAGSGEPTFGFPSRAAANDPSMYQTGNVNGLAGPESGYGSRPQIPAPPGFRDTAPSGPQNGYGNGYRPGNGHGAGNGAAAGPAGSGGQQSSYFSAPPAGPSGFAPGQYTPGQPSGAGYFPAPAPAGPPSATPHAGAPGSVAQGPGPQHTAPAPVAPITGPVQAAVPETTSAGLPKRTRNTSRADRPKPVAPADRWAPQPSAAGSGQYQPSRTPELDAQAARSAIEEFESGVELALQSSADALRRPGYAPSRPSFPDAAPTGFGAPADTTDEKGEQR